MKDEKVTVEDSHVEQGNPFRYKTREGNNSPTSKWLFDSNGVRYIRPAYHG